jgi:MFS family permease
LSASLADVRDGVGPYLALFLASRAGWPVSRVGWALAAASVATLLANAPAGSLLDGSARKRGWLVAAALAIGGSCLAMTVVDGFWPIIALQAICGISAALLGPGIAAISLDLVGQGGFPRRIGRNEGFNRGGNIAAAAIAGFLARVGSLEWAFYFVALMSTFSAVFICLIKREAIEGAVASGAAAAAPGFREFFRSLAFLRQRRFAAVLAMAALLQFANASLLPIAAQTKGAGLNLLAIGIAVAQAVAIPAAWLAGRDWPDAAILAVGFAATAGRAFAFALASNQIILIGAQALDGVTAGVIAVAPILAIASLAGGSGRFTLCAGLLATAIGIGASASDAVGGYLAQVFGPGRFFCAMGGISAFSSLALLRYQLRSSKTGPGPLSALRRPGLGRPRPASADNSGAME